DLLVGARDPAAGLDLDDPPRLDQTIEVLLHAAALDVVREEHVVARPVHETVGDDLLERTRHGEERHEPGFALGDLGGETVEAIDERVPPLEDADVVEGRVPTCPHRAYPRER